MKQIATLIVDIPENQQVESLVHYFIIPNIDNIVKLYDLRVLRMTHNDQKIREYGIREFPCLNFNDMNYYNKHIKLMLLGKHNDAMVDSSDLPVNKEVERLVNMPVNERKKSISPEPKVEGFEEEFNRRRKEMESVKKQHLKNTPWGEMANKMNPSPSTPGPGSNEVDYDRPKYDETVLTTYEEYQKAHITRGDQ